VVSLVRGRRSEEKEVTARFASVIKFSLGGKFLEHLMNKKHPRSIDPGERWLIFLMEKTSVYKCRRLSLWLVLVIIASFVGCKTTPDVIAYDQNLNRKIENRWYALLDETKWPSPEKSGKTVVTFNLYPDGKTDALKVVTNTAPVSELVALQAIKDCTPFPKWPDDMRRMVITDKKDYREITFTFDYYK
jgi:hypothetical protein